MLTGDNGETARQIGMSCGILKNESENPIVHIKQSADLTDLVKTTRGSKDQVLIEAIVLVKFQKDFPDLME